MVGAAQQDLSDNYPSLRIILGGVRLAFWLERRRFVGPVGIRWSFAAASLHRRQGARGGVLGVERIEASGASRELGGWKAWHWVGGLAAQGKHGRGGFWGAVLGFGGRSVGEDFSLDPPWMPPP